MGLVVIVALLAWGAARAAPLCGFSGLDGCAPGLLLAEHFGGSGAWVLDGRLSATGGATLAVATPPEFARLASNQTFSAAWPCGPGPFGECDVAGFALEPGAEFLALSAPNSTVSGWIRVRAVSRESTYALIALGVGLVLLSVTLAAWRRVCRRAAAKAAGETDIELGSFPRPRAQNEALLADHNPYHNDR